MKNKILLSLAVVILVAAITFSFLKFREAESENQKPNTEEEKALVMLSDLTDIKKSKFKYVRRENDSEFVFSYKKSKDITTYYTINVSTNLFHTEEKIIMN